VAGLARRHLPVNLLLMENRIRQFMEHSTRYAFMGEMRLAKDCGVSDAAICRLLIGYSSPSFAMLVKITQALSRQAVRQELRERLTQMEFLAFERLMRSLLCKSGYLSMHPIGRNYRRGRTPQGGLDLTARSVTEISSTLTIAQVKQYRRVVSRRFVDELRGAMLRLGTEQGLLLTMSRFSKAVHEAAQESCVAPITLIEGDEVMDLLFAYRIGVTECKGGWRIDSTYA
jgi:HJR/Mrr/RecB family endonuclease